MENLEGSRKVAVRKHESVEALLAAYPGERDAKALIRRLAREKVARAKVLGWEGPPFCPMILASIFGIKCREVHHDIGGDGRILPYSDGKLRIEYRAGRLPERQRFTIFHEFAHTLFPDFCEFLPRHHAPQKKARDPDKEFEHLCDLGAAEMLLPFDDFSRDLSQHGTIGFELVHTLRKRYEASIDATAHRLMDLANHVSCAAVFLTDQRGTFAGRGPLWVKYMAPNREFKGFIRPGTTPSQGSVVLQCYQDGIETTEPVRETWWINGKPRTWLVQATKLPSISDNPEYPKVVALLLPSGYRSAQQRMPILS